MQENADEWAQMVLEHEGGYVNDPADPGGATKYGVIQRTLDRVRQDNPKLTFPRYVPNLTKAQAKSIFRMDYWDAVAGDELPSGIDVAVADMAINQGVRDAVVALQQTVGTKTDGAMGPKTMAAVWAEDDWEALLVDFSAYRALNYAQLGDTLVDRFGFGWYRRMLRTMLHAQVKM